MKNNTLYCPVLSDWHTWLKNNYNSCSEIWLIFYKKETGKPNLSYNESVEEALCFGWIDSLIKNLDVERYARKFTPRKEDSKWSEINKKRVEKMIQLKRMQPSGIKLVNIAKENGQWYKIQNRPVFPDPVMPDIFKKELNNNKGALNFFNNLSPFEKKQYYFWIKMAKRDETKKRRVAEAICKLSRHEKLGLK